MTGGAKAFATDSGVLVSMSVPTNTQLMPRTIFTETWTIKNNGTTTWTATSAGYTLNLISWDTLGAIQLYTNTVAKRFTPSAIIASGKSIGPGTNATFSMEFIAPEAAGTYTDTFQLNNSSSQYFGPDFTVQITVKSAGSTNQYDRARAVSYANNYAGFICSDGYFWTNGSDYYDYGTNVPTPTNLIGDDCAHFVSCCIGRQASMRGGGLNIPTRVSPTYGEPSAPRLATTCLIAPGYAVEVSSLSQMLPGDVVGWNWEGDTNMANLDHITLYLGNGLLAAHAASCPRCLGQLVVSRFGTELCPPSHPHLRRAHHWGGRHGREDGSVVGHQLGRIHSAILDFFGDERTLERRPDHTDEDWGHERGDQHHGHGQHRRVLSPDASLILPLPLSKPGRRVQ